MSFRRNYCQPASILFLFIAVILPNILNSNFLTISMSTSYSSMSLYDLLILIKVECSKGMFKWQAKNSRVILLDACVGSLYLEYD